MLTELGMSFFLRSSVPFAVIFQPLLQLFEMGLIVIDVLRFIASDLANIKSLTKSAAAARAFIVPRNDRKDGAPIAIITPKIETTTIVSIKVNP